MDTNEVTVWTAEQAHLVQAALVDVRYALAQMERLGSEYVDQRAKDALERAEESLVQAMPESEALLDDEEE